MIDITDLCHLYLPAPPCLLSQTVKGVTQTQVRLHKCRQFGAYTERFGIGLFLLVICEWPVVRWPDRRASNWFSYGRSWNILKDNRDRWFLLSSRAILQVEKLFTMDL